MRSRMSRQPFQPRLWSLRSFSETKGPWVKTISVEAAPRGLVSSTAGIIIGSGEIFGGGVAPSLAGAVAQHFGLQHTLTMALTGLSIGIVVCLFLRETAPRKTPSAG